MSSLLLLVGLSAHAQQIATTCVPDGWSMAASMPECHAVVTTHEATCDGTGAPPSTVTSIVNSTVGASIFSGSRCFWDVAAGTVTNDFCTWYNYPATPSFPGCAIDCDQADAALSQLGNLAVHEGKLGSAVGDLLVARCDEQLPTLAEFEQSMDLLQAYIDDIAALDQLYSGACPGLGMAWSDAVQAAASWQGLFDDAFCYDDCSALAADQQAAVADAQLAVTWAQKQAASLDFCDDVLSGLEGVSAYSEAYMSATGALAGILAEAQDTTCDGLLDPAPAVPPFEAPIPDCDCLEAAETWLDAEAVLAPWLQSGMMKTVCDDQVAIQDAWVQANNGMLGLVDGVSQCLSQSQSTELSSTLVSWGDFVADVNTACGP